MRFHFGISFNWKTIKKFLFPILIGLLAYLGFGGIFDKFNLGFLKVNAQENYNTYFYLTYSDYSRLLDKKIDDNLSVKEFLDNVISLTSDTHDLFILFNSQIKNNVYSFEHFNLIVVNKTSSQPISLYTRGGSYLNLSFNNGIGGISYNFDLTTSVSDIYSTQTYQDFESCYVSNTNCSNTTLGTYIVANCSNTTNNTDSAYCSFGAYSQSNGAYNSSYGMFYYSSVPLYYSPYSGYVSSTSYFFKTLDIEGTIVEVDDYFITYKEYLDSLVPDNPDNPDNPTDDNTVHKALFNKIYWFDDKNTIYGVLSSIYILLFLYCLSMVLFKVATLLKNKRW